MKRKKKTAAPSVRSVEGQPGTVPEMLNKYGTYNIQPTADTDNPYPAIAQGLAQHAKHPK